MAIDGSVGRATASRGQSPGETSPYAPPFAPRCPRRRPRIRGQASRVDRGGRGLFGRAGIL